MRSASIAGRARDRAAAFSAQERREASACRACGCGGGSRRVLCKSGSVFRRLNMDSSRVSEP